MWLVRHRIFIYVLVSVITLSSTAAITFWGLRPSIEFTGGSLLEVSYGVGRPEKTSVEEKLSPLSLGEYSLRASGESGYILRTRTLSAEEYATVESTLRGAASGGEMTLVRTALVGPMIGSELKSKAGVAIVIVVILIGLYVAFAFREVSRPISSWWYGLITILVLVHDVLVPAGVYAAAGHFWGAEVDVLFVTALLTILGYSVNDTIVVFDRIREHLRINEADRREEPFENLVGRAIYATLGRSFNTSFTVLLVVLALLFLGGDTTRFFSLTLAAGVIAGTYSSIALASPLLVSVYHAQKKNHSKEENKEKNKGKK